MPVEPCRIAALQGDVPASDQSGSDVGNALDDLFIGPVVNWSSTLCSM
jgi:hypothetical protein